MKLCIPEAILDQHLVVLGKTGAGKSSALRHVVEHLLRGKKRVCVIDPKGDWWGLKLAANGKDPGLPVIMFGDFKEPKAADVPINPQSGRHVAELIASGNRPAVIGLRGWHTADMHRFWIDFASTLFAKNVGELYFVGDEFHNFAPKGKILSPQAGESLHWSNRLLSEGRGLGLVCLLASQRPQKVHNDTLTSCETLVGMRVVHAADREAIKEWIDGNGDPQTGREVMNSLAGLDRGEAWVWSPEIGFGPKRVKFPMFETFDSFAPPQLQKRVSNTGWADVDLAAVKEKLAAVIEEHRANDPGELKKANAKLRAELARAQQAKPATPARAAPAAKEKRVEIAVLKDGQLDRADKLVGRLAELFTKAGEAQQQVKAIADEIAAAIRKTTQPMAMPARVPSILRQMIVRPSPRPIVPREPRERPSSGTNGDASVLGKGERAILVAAAQHSDGVDREQLTVLTGYKRSSRDTYLQHLQANGYVDGSSGRIVATTEGMAALGDDFEALPTGAALREYWLNRLTGGEQKILEILCGQYPAAVPRDELTEATGYRRSSRDTYLQRLQARKLVASVGRGEVKASDLLFS